MRGKPGLIIILRNDTTFLPRTSLSPRCLWPSLYLVDHTFSFKSHTAKRPPGGLGADYLGLQLLWLLGLSKIAPH